VELCTAIATVDFVLERPLGDRRPHCQSRNEITQTVGWVAQATFKFSAVNGVPQVGYAEVGGDARSQGSPGLGEGGRRQEVV
jgi:hypothetical protein